MISKQIIISLLLTMQLYADEIIVTIFTGEDIRPYESLIMEQRQSVFGEFPHLMCNGDEFESQYKMFFRRNTYGALAVAFKKDTPVGFLTGIPLESFDSELAVYGCDKISDEISDIIDTKQTYYFGDAIILKEHRGQKIVDKLTQALEQHVKNLGCFSSISLVTFIRDENDPRKPIGYVYPAKVWSRLGYHKVQRYIHYDSPTYQLDGSIEFEPNTSHIWIKSLH